MHGARRYIINVMTVFVIAFSFVACGNGRQAELNAGLDTMLDGSNLRIGIARPVVKDDITDAVADRLCIKMLEIAAQNYISGLAANPSFVLGAEINQKGRSATDTTPQEMTVEYEIVFKMINTITGEVFGETSQEVMGAGNSYEEASVNAMNDVGNTPEMQYFLYVTDERIVNWYDNHVDVLRHEVEKAEAAGDYALAMAILENVPDRASVAYQYAATEFRQAIKGMLHQQGPICNKK